MNLRISDWSRVFVQWEIADALRARGIPIPDECVAWPPRFTTNEVTEPARLALKLAERITATLAYVYGRLPQRTRNVIDEYAKSRTLPAGHLACELRHGLNALLEYAEFHQRVPRSIGLPQLVRDLTREVREYPPPGEVLARGQVVRVNRLILESLFRCDGLGPGKYLSSKDVLATVMGAMSAKRITDVILVANPGHMYRCWELTQEAASEEGLKLDLSLRRLHKSALRCWLSSILDEKPARVLGIRCHFAGQGAGVQADPGRVSEQGSGCRGPRGRGGARR